MVLIELVVGTGKLPVMPTMLERLKDVKLERPSKAVGKGPNVFWLLEKSTDKSPEGHALGRPPTESHPPSVNDCNEVMEA